MRNLVNSDPVRDIIHYFHRSEPISFGSVAATKCRLKTAGCVIVATMMLAFVARGASAADMPMKAPQQTTAYQWSGCYAGLNLGGGASGTNFNSAVDPGTYLLGADPAVVAGSGSGGHSGDGLLAGGQVGCNLQSGMLVAGLEGDFDYFHSNSWFSNGSYCRVACRGSGAGVDHLHNGGFRLVMEMA